MQPKNQLRSAICGKGWTDDRNKSIHTFNIALHNVHDCERACVRTSDETGQKAIEVNVYRVPLRSSYFVYTHITTTTATLLKLISCWEYMFIVCFVHYLLFINFITKINKIACKSKSYPCCFTCYYTRIK